METRTVIEALSLKRSFAHSLAAAYDMVIADLGLPSAGAPSAPTQVVRLTTRPKVRTVRAPTPTLVAKEQLPMANEPGPSKVAQYRDAVVKVLGRYENGADGTVIRREVAKACGINPERDERFRGDVSNALSALKQAGRVDRSGQVWALVG